MIDYGATNNFILSQVVHELELPYSNCHKFGVTLGIGEDVWGQGELKEVHLKLHGMTMPYD